MSRLVRTPGLKFIPIKSGLMTIHRGALRKKGSNAEPFFTALDGDTSDGFCRDFVEPSAVFP